MIDYKLHDLTPDDFANIMGGYQTCSTYLSNGFTHACLYNSVNYGSIYNNTIGEFFTLDE